MFYEKSYILEEPVGNNLFSYEERGSILGYAPNITIPSLIEGTIDDIVLGETVVFEEVSDGKISSCTGLKHFVRLKGKAIPITIFDNHNHALYFWIEAIEKRKMGSNISLIHIDQHSDLWKNTNTLERERALKDKKYAWEFTNFSCNVGNYILPALHAGLIGDIIRIENEHNIDEYVDRIPKNDFILNIDLDFFSPELDFIPEKKKIHIIEKLLPHAQCVTIATSPYFIDQWKALNILKYLFQKEEKKSSKYF